MPARGPASAGRTSKSPPSCPHGWHGQPGHAPPRSCQSLQEGRGSMVSKCIGCRKCPHCTQSWRNLGGSIKCMHDDLQHPGRPALGRSPAVGIGRRPGFRLTGRAVEEHSAWRRNVEALKQLWVCQRQEDHLLEGLASRAPSKASGQLSTQDTHPPVKQHARARGSIQHAPARRTGRVLSAQAAASCSPP